MPATKLSQAIRRLWASVRRAICSGPFIILQPTASGGGSARAPAGLDPASTQISKQPGPLDEGIDLSRPRTLMASR